MRQVKCRAHCGGCGRHFSSQAAFDAHRQGNYPDDRHCVQPWDDEQFAAEDGVCQMYAQEATGEVWYLPEQREAVRAAFR